MGGCAGGKCVAWARFFDGVGGAGVVFFYKLTRNPYLTKNLFFFFFFFGGGGGGGGDAGLREQGG